MSSKLEMALQLPADWFETHFWRKCEKTETGCWNWLGPKNAQGYGQIKIKIPGHPMFRIYVHRLSCALINGALFQDERVCDHLCRNPACVNPAHIEIVARRENTMRGKTLAAKNAAKTHCSKGHPYNKENTRYEKNPGYTRRVCLLCKQAAHFNWSQKRRNKMEAAGHVFSYPRPGRRAKAERALKERVGAATSQIAPEPHSPSQARKTGTD